MLFWTLYLVFTTSAYSMHLSGMRLFDLEHQGNNFIAESTQWSAMMGLQNPPSPPVKTTICGENIILGGVGLLQNQVAGNGWYRMYKNLPPHQGLTLQMTVYPLEAWTDGDYFSVEVMGFFSQSYWPLNQQTNPSVKGNICGPDSSLPDIAPVVVYLTVPHQTPGTSSLQIFLMPHTSRPSEEASVGVRDVVITFFNSTDSQPISLTTCGVAPFDLPDRYCTCDAATPMQGTSGTCTSCDLTCSLCNKPGPNGCTACSAGFYLTASGACEKCDSSCKTCSGDANYCILCAKAGFLSNSTGYCPPAIDCPSPLKVIDGVCKSNCPANQYLAWDGNTCLDECVAPLKFQTVSSFSVCTFPCTDNSHYLYWDGSCESACPSSLFKTMQFVSRNFCFPCRGNELYSYWNGTCADLCPSPLIIKKLGSRQLCTYPCISANQYLYLDGSCKDDCPSPFTVQVAKDNKKFCTLVCNRTQYLDTDKKTCKNIYVSGEFSIDIVLNGKPTKVSQLDKKFVSAQDSFTLFSQDYTLGPKWTFFALHPLGKYAIDEWEVSAKCGCFIQSCGNQCKDSGAGCFTYQNKSTTQTTICHPWAPQNNYCWSLHPSRGGKTWHRAYSLEHIATIALTSYSGIDQTFVRPGFTLSDNKKDLDFAMNGFLTQLSPSVTSGLEKSYRYVESEGRVIRTEEFTDLNMPPELTAGDLTLATCNSSDVHLPLQLKPKSKNFKPLHFHTYLVSKKPKSSAKISDIASLSILTPKGFEKWAEEYHSKFDFIDVCNQQFLTLQRDRVGRFFVELPKSQRLANFESTFCIAVQTNPAFPTDLALYEVKNLTMEWFPSDRFTGLLSNDYIQDFTLRLTTNTNEFVSISSNEIQILFDLQSDSTRIKVSTSLPTNCQLYLSSTCKSVRISTTVANALQASKSIPPECGPLYERAAYNCEGMTGYFFPPSQLVKTPISGFVVANMSMAGQQNRAIGSFKNTAESEELLSYFYRWITHWNRENYLTKIFVIFVWVLIVAVGCLCYQNAYKKYRNYDRINDPHNDEKSIYDS